MTQTLIQPNPLIQTQSEIIEILQHDEELLRDERIVKALDVLIKLAWFDGCRLKLFAVNPDYVYMSIEGQIRDVYQWKKALNSILGIRIKVYVDVDNNESEIYVYPR